jgi:hypothetical protein
MPTMRLIAESSYLYYPQLRVSIAIVHELWSQFGKASIAIVVEEKRRPILKLADELST